MSLTHGTSIFRGINYIRSSLNWGPTVQLNRVFKTFAFWFDRRGSFGDEFHTFTLEWTPDFLCVSMCSIHVSPRCEICFTPKLNHAPHHRRVYVDTRIKRTLDVRFNTPFFARGDFPDTIINNSQIVPLENPWAGRGNSAPFDQRTLFDD